MNKIFVNKLAFPQRGQKKGGGQNLTRRPPTENSFRPPSPRYVLPPPYSISLRKSLRSAQYFPQPTTSENSFRRVSKNGFRRAILARFCFSIRFAPPPLALPSFQILCVPKWTFSRAKWENFAFWGTEKEGLGEKNKSQKRRRQSIPQRRK